MEELPEKLPELKKILEKYIKKGKVNHAYLIETNAEDRIEIAIELVKKILSFEKNGTINELNNNNDLQIIKTENQTIKKEEILALKEKFKTKSIYSSKRIYIIEEAEKLNNSSANTLLKFLEEPETDIIGILVTKNRNMVINTIVSRCQTIRYHAKDDSIMNCDPEYLENLFHFITNIETKKEKSIAYLNQLNIKELSDRKLLAEFFKNMLCVYSDVLHKKIGSELNYFFTYDDQIEIIANNNSIGEIKNKINAINECINRTKYNTNIKLLLDKLIIWMTGVDVDV